MIVSVTTHTLCNYSYFISHKHTLLPRPPVFQGSRVWCGVVWMVEISGCSVQDAAWLMEILVVSVVSKEMGVKSPLDLGRTF